MTRSVQPHFHLLCLSTFPHPISSPNTYHFFTTWEQNRYILDPLIFSVARLSPPQTTFISHYLPLPSVSMNHLLSVLFSTINSHAYLLSSVMPLHIYCDPCSPSFVAVTSILPTHPVVTSILSHLFSPSSLLLEVMSTHFFTVFSPIIPLFISLSDSFAYSKTSISLPP